MSDLSSSNFEKSIKNYKNILKGILKLNLIISVIHAIASIIVLILYKNYNPSLFQRNLRMGLRDSNVYIPCSIVILSFFLYFLTSIIIPIKFPDHELIEIFKLFKSLNNISFFFLFLFYFRDFLIIFPLFFIILLGVYLSKYSKLRKKENNKILNRYIFLNLIFLIIGSVLSIFSEMYEFVKVGPIFAIIGLILINMKFIPYFSLDNSETIKIIKKPRPRLPQTQLYGQIRESKIKPAQEIKVEKGEFESEFVKISKKSTQEEVVEQIYESINQPEIIIKEPEITIKEEFSQPILETTFLKPEIKPELIKKPEIALKEDISQKIPKTTTLKPEIKPESNEQTELLQKIEISPKKVETKMPGLLNFEINRKKVLEKPIRSNFAKVEAKPRVLKKCPFCGKKREDLNVPFCYACGYKF